MILFFFVMHPISFKSPFRWRYRVVLLTTMWCTGIGMGDQLGRSVHLCVSAPSPKTSSLLSLPPSVWTFIHLHLKVSDDPRFHGSRMWSHTSSGFFNYTKMTWFFSSRLPVWGHEVLVQSLCERSGPRRYLTHLCNLPVFFLSFILPQELDHPSHIMCCIFQVHWFPTFRGWWHHFDITKVLFSGTDSEIFICCIFLIILLKRIISR